MMVKERDYEKSVETVLMAGLKLLSHSLPEETEISDIFQSDYWFRGRNSITDHRFTKKE
jgi:hypothetical protein